MKGVVGKGPFDTGGEEEEEIWPALYMVQSFVRDCVKRRKHQHKLAFDLNASD
jgi:hypothetical protein